MKYYNYPDPRGTEVAENVDSKNISDFAPGGGGGEAFIVTVTGAENVGLVCDKTWKEIKDAMLAGKSVLYSFTERDPSSGDLYSDLGPITVVIYDGTSSAPYLVKIVGIGEDNFCCSTENDYPTYTNV